jgi:hypothetical protein
VRNTKFQQLYLASDRSATMQNTNFHQPPTMLPLSVFCHHSWHIVILHFATVSITMLNNADALQTKQYCSEELHCANCQSQFGITKSRGTENKWYYSCSIVSHSSVTLTCVFCIIMLLK